MERNRNPLKDKNNQNINKILFLFWSDKKNSKSHSFILYEIRNSSCYLTQTKKALPVFLKQNWQQSQLKPPQSLRGENWFQIIAALSKLLILWNAIKLTILHKPINDMSKNQKLLFSHHYSQPITSPAHPNPFPMSAPYWWSITASAAWPLSAQHLAGAECPPHLQAAARTGPPSREWNSFSQTAGGKWKQDIARRRH